MSPTPLPTPKQHRDLACVSSDLPFQSGGCAFQTCGPASPSVPTWAVIHTVVLCLFRVADPQLTHVFVHYYCSDPHPCQLSGHHFFISSLTKSLQVCLCLKTYFPLSHF